MIRKIFLLFISCGVFASFAWAFNPQDNRAYKYLNSLDKKGGFVAVSNFLDSQDVQRYISTSDDVISFGVWLRDMHFNPSRDLRYGFLYARHMEDLSKKVAGIKAVSDEYKGTAALAYFTAYLKLENAISRCDDNGVGLMARKNWLVKSNKFREILLNSRVAKDPVYFEATVQHAERSINADPIVWVCLDGAGVMLRAIQAGEKEEKIEDPEGLGRNATIVDTSKYVEFISDADWKVRREQNAKKLKKYLLGQ